MYYYRLKVQHVKITILYQSIGIVYNMIFVWVWYIMV